MASITEPFRVLPWNLTPRRFNGTNATSKESFP